MVRNVDIADSLSYASNPSSIMQDTNLLINGFSHQLESIRITNSSAVSSQNTRNAPKKYKTFKNKSTRPKSKESEMFRYERLQTQQFDDNENGDSLATNNAHALIKDFLSDLTNSENKRQMELIMAEAKRAITEYD